MLKIHTYQIAKWRKVSLKNIPMIDTTVKSGVKELAPTWDMVMQHKKGILPNEEYTEAYYKILDYNYEHYPDFFKNLFLMGNVAFGCYCRNGNFCHRYLLTKWLEAKTEVAYCGEIT